MVRHNNIIPYGHFHKDWQAHLKTWFNQPKRKEKRNRKRITKVFKQAPKPVDFLRPIVRCPSVRYHTKARVGRGFSLQELKAASINKHFARTIGIAVDNRRKNCSQETLLANKQRLLEYKSKLILSPGMKVPCAIVTIGLNKIKAPAVKFNPRNISEEENKFSAYETLRKARREGRTLRQKLKRQKTQNFVDQDAVALKAMTKGKKKKAAEDE